MLTEHILTETFANYAQRLLAWVCGIPRMGTPQIILLAPAQPVDSLLQIYSTTALS